MTGFSKRRENWEQRYVSEYVLEFYPDSIAKYRCPLGAIPATWVEMMGIGKAAKTYRPYRPECDAAVITADEIILIEGKIMKVLDGLAKLPIYKWLIPKTPEFLEYKSLPVIALLVTPKEPQWEAEVAEHLGVEVDVFVPEWIEDYYSRQERYWTAEERAKREKRSRVLSELGY